jgi:allophanate hydrolase subunit 2
MTVLATVLEPGLSTVQDGGRSGLTDVGVPRAGAWHRRRYADASRLVHGAADDRRPSIELLAGRLQLQWEISTTVTVVGPASLRLAGRSVPGGVALGVEASTILSVEHESAGPVYVSIAGWQEPQILGSASTDTFSGISVHDIRAGTTLHGSVTPRDVTGSFLREAAPSAGPLRVLIPSGTQAHQPPGWVGASWTVSTTARSGTRIIHGPLESRASQPSAPVVVGAIQATPSGEAIILGPDGALTGGYPIIGVVCTADLPRVSELRPGDAVSFRVIGIDEAVRAWERVEQSSTVVRPSDVTHEGSLDGG